MRTNGIRVHGKRGRRFTKWLSMAELAERLGIEGEEAIREARSQLLRAQTRAGVQLMWKRTESSRGHWYTTEALVVRHAPELIDVAPETVQAVQELRKLVMDRLDAAEDHAKALETETRRAFQNVNRRLETIEARNKTRQDTTSTRAIR